MSSSNDGYADHLAPSPGGSVVGGTVLVGIQAMAAVSIGIQEGL